MSIPRPTTNTTFQILALIGAGLAGLAALFLRLTAPVWTSTDCVSYANGCSADDALLWPIIDALVYLAGALLVLGVAIAVTRLVTARKA